MVLSGCGYNEWDKTENAQLQIVIKKFLNQAKTGIFLTHKIIVALWNLAHGYK